MSSIASSRRSPSLGLVPAAAGPGSPAAPRRRPRPSRSGTGPARPGGRPARGSVEPATSAAVSRASAYSFSASWQEAGVADARGGRQRLVGLAVERPRGPRPSGARPRPSRRGGWRGSRSRWTGWPGGRTPGRPRGRPSPRRTDAGTRRRDALRSTRGIVAEVLRASGPRRRGRSRASRTPARRSPGGRRRPRAALQDAQLVLEDLGLLVDRDGPLRGLRATSASNCALSFRSRPT